MYTIGIDLGGTNIVAGLVDDACKILSTAKVKTNLPRDPEAIIDDMVALCDKVIAQAGLVKSDIEYIGIGCPGTCNP